MNEQKQTEWDRPAHLCVSELCKFGKTTVVNGYIVSSVGEYVARGGKGFERIGCDRLYETMVFKDSGKRCEIPECDCGRLPEPQDFGDRKDFAAANDRTTCLANHARLVEKYSALVS